MGEWRNDVDALLRDGIATHTFPAAAVAIGVGDADPLHLRAVGNYTYDRGSALVSVSSRFDLASLTKVVATTTAVMLLEERGVLSLDATVASYFPAFAQKGKDEVTVRHLLTHTSGLPAFREYEREGIVTRQGVVDAILAEPLYSAPGTAFVYSDFGCVCLPACLTACLPACLPACLLPCLPVRLSVSLSVGVSACLRAYLFACMPACLSHPVSVSGRSYSQW